MWIAEEEMAFSQENQDWIRTEIRTAIDRYVQPHGWRRAVFVLRELGPLIAIIGVFVALFGITIGALVQAFGHLKEETDFRTHTGDRLDKIESSLLILRASRAAETPINTHSQQEAKLVLAEAKKTPLNPLPAPVVERAGKSFIEAASSDPKAWGVGLDFVAYRTSLNEIEPPVGGWKEGTTHYDLYFIEDRRPLVQNCCGVSMAQAARLERIGHNLNTGTDTGPARLFIRGGTIVLDGFYLKQVSLQNVEVHYSGKPIILENVTFVNCTFVLDNTDSGRRFGLSLLASSSVSFKDQA